MKKVRRSAVRPRQERIDLSSLSPEARQMVMNLFCLKPGGKKAPLKKKPTGT